METQLKKRLARGGRIRGADVELYFMKFFARMDMGRPLMDGYTKFVVGERFPVRVSGEVLFRILCGKPSFIMNVPAPMKEEIDAMNEDDVAIGLYDAGSLFFFLVKFGRMQWMDTPSHALQNAPEERGYFFDLASRLGKDNGTPVHFYLVDADTGILKAMRMTIPSYDFSMKLAEILRMEESQPFDENAFYGAARRYYQMFPTSEAMARKAQEWYVRNK